MDLFQRGVNQSIIGIDNIIVCNDNITIHLYLVLKSLYQLEKKLKHQITLSD